MPALQKKHKKSSVHNIKSVMNTRYGNPAQFGCRWQGVYSQKVGSAAEALRGRLQPSSRNKRDFLRKRRSSFVSLAPT